MTQASRDTQPDRDDTPGPQGGIGTDNDTSGRDQIQAGRDVVGRDVIGGDSAGRDVIKSETTVTGFSAAAVQRLVITVGVMVFATAVCFFSGGLAVGALVLNRLGEPVNSNQAAALSMQAKLAAAQNLPSDRPHALVFGEDELSSYVRFIVGPGIGLSDGRARLIEPGVVAIGGRLQSLANLNVAATFSLQPGTDRKAKLESAAVQLLPTGGTLGWVVVPNFLVASFADQINQSLGTGYAVLDVQALSPTQWAVAIERW